MVSIEIDGPPRRIHQMTTLAIEQAKNSDQNNRHGAVVFAKNRVLGVGWNKDKTHPAAKKYFSKNIHAELAAILNTNKKDLVGASILVVRIFRRPDGGLAMSKPCKYCMALIREAGIRLVFFSTADGRISKLKT